MLFGARRLPIGYARVRLDHAGAPQHLRGRPRHRCCSPATCDTAASRSTSPARCKASTYALSRWTSLLLATLVFVLAPARDHVRRRAARRARLQRADQGGVGRRLPRPPARPHPDRASAGSSLAGRPGAASRRRHHRRAADRQRHRHRDAGHRRRVRGRRDVGQVAGLFSPYSLYRGLAFAWATPTSRTPPTSTGMEAAYARGLRRLSPPPAWPGCSGATGRWRGGDAR